ncbi:hypothetical protein ACWG8W_06445 [Citricoccus zhacaiensis]
METMTAIAPDKDTGSHDKDRLSGFFDGLDASPPLYGTEAEPGPAKLAYAHYTLDTGRTVGHWWVAEYDPGSQHAYGYRKLESHPEGTWGYFSLRTLSSVISRKGQGVVRDSGWSATPMAEVFDAEGWRW